MVAEYTSNPLAGDSDDEKRIYKAQVRADSKTVASTMCDKEITN